MSDMNINEYWNEMIPTDVKHILRKLDKAGYEAYIVGGCVRDIILHKTPHNWNIATSATPEQIYTVFSPDCQCLKTEKKYGTVTIIIKDKPYEIATYRTGGVYSNNSKTNSVHFTTNLLEDLQHRDFTVNAMAYNPERGIGLVDPFNGMESLKANVICCVGNPNNRFAEDGLRILRALRFATQLNFTIEKKTSESIHKKKYLLNNISNNISKKRIQSELVKILMCDDCTYAFTLYSDVITQIIKNYTR